MDPGQNASQRPSKRLRESTEGAVALDQCTRHPTLYCSDGNIVLFCEKTLFKAYMGLLSRNADVFENMFSLSSHQPADQETYDGSPVVRLQDTAEDFGNFLSLILNPASFVPNQKIPFRKFAGILRISTKYEASAIRGLLEGFLEQSFPTSIHSFDSETVMFSEPLPHDNSVVLLLQECNVMQCLPVALYRACEWGLGTFLDEHPEVRLPPALQRSATMGAAALKAAEFAAMEYTFDRNVPNITTCQVDTPLKWSEARVHCFQFRDEMTLSVLDKMTETTNFGGKFCLDCRRTWAQRYNSKRVEIWKKLPSLFNLPPWAELKKARSD